MWLRAVTLALLLCAAGPILPVRADMRAGNAAFERGDYARAESVLREAHALEREASAIDPVYRGASAASLASLLHYSGRYAEAEALMRHALDERVRALGADGFGALVTRQLLADVLHSRGRYDEAERELTHALERARATLGGEDPLVLNLERNLADVLRSRSGATPCAVRKPRSASDGSTAVPLGSNPRRST